MLPDLTSLALLRHAVDTRSLSKSAERMHITLSAASRRISLLEHQFGIEFFGRPPGGGIEPTPAGIIVAKGVDKVLQEIERMQQELAEYVGGIRGSVRLFVNTTAMAQGLPQELARFSQSRPHIKIEVRERRSADIPTFIHEGAGDIGIVMEGAIVDGLDVRDYKVDRLCIIVPQGHPLHAERVAFQDLLDYDFIGLDTNALQTERMLSAATVHGKNLKLRAQTQSFEALCRMVEAGMGVGMLSSAAARSYVPSLRIRMIEVSDAWVERKILLCVRPGELDAPAEELLSFLADS
ncbi:LysR family transcriptional regulator [Bordetella petrii]|uniref:LysR family transcriptional regulator n=1 Tax=Bordetella petrii TaxID=94624 RepID=UPI001E4220D5|nr:LysR family transcriptional regulator [Bordetella petrii]MCD0504068.1 LysR family transcriptional regulator [Bordetella petrii]